MKTKITLGSFAILLALFFTSYNELSANGGGSPGGRSSSMGDNGSSCGQGGCHGGGHTTQAGIITTDIPATGYVPGDVYTIGVVGTSGTGSKFGFELAAEDASNVSAGTLAPTDGRTQALSNDHVTHTSSGNTGGSGNFGWSLNWTAPAAGSGDVTFSTAVLVANNNGQNTGDAAIRYSTTVSEMASTSTIAEITAENTKLYPNPVENYLNVFSQNKNIRHIQVMNMEGKLVFDQTISSVDRVDVSNLKKGMYFVTVSGNGKSMTQKMLKI